MQRTGSGIPSLSRTLPARISKKQKNRWHWWRAGLRYHSMTETKTERKRRRRRQIPDKYMSAELRPLAWPVRERA